MELRNLILLMIPKLSGKMVDNFMGVDGIATIYLLGIGLRFPSHTTRAKTVALRARPLVYRKSCF